MRVFLKLPAGGGVVMIFQDASSLPFEAFFLPSCTCHRITNAHQHRLGRVKTASLRHIAEFVPNICPEHCPLGSRSFHRAFSDCSSWTYNRNIADFLPLWNLNLASLAALPFFYACMYITLVILYCGIDMTAELDTHE